MADRGELGSSLLGALNEIALLLQQALSAAASQQEALVSGDAEAIVASCKAMDEIMRRVGEADQRAAVVAARLAEAAGLDIQTEDNRAIARAAGDPYVEPINAVVERIARAAAGVKQAHEVNRRLLANGLDIITNCLRTLATDSAPGPYSRDASLSGPEAHVLSMDTRV